MICMCVCVYFLLTNTSTFSTILQVLKVLLTAVASAKFRGTVRKIIFLAQSWPSVAGKLLFLCFENS